MKILYTANERHDAQLAANAFDGLAPDVKVTWAARLWDAGKWLAENRDVSAMVVDADVQEQSCAPLVRHVRALGFTIPIVVVVPEDAAVPAAVLKAGADEFAVRNASLFTNLAASVSRVMRREQAERRLQALATEHEGLREYEARLQAALDAKAQSLERLEEQLKNEGQTRQKLDGRLAAALTLLQQRDADVEVTAARLRTREEELAEAADARRAFEQQVVRLKDSFKELARRSAADRLVATQEAAERQTRFELALAEQAARREALDQELGTVREELSRAGGMLREAEERHLSAATKAIEDERDAARRHGDLARELSQEIAARRDAEQDLDAYVQRLAASESALHDATRRYDADMTSAAAELVDCRAEYESRLADADSARVVVEERVREFEALLDRSRDERSTERAAAAGREASLTADLTDLRSAAERAAAERLVADEDAAQRKAEFEVAIAQANAAQLAVEQELVVARQKWAQSDAARVDAEAQHASAVLDAAVAREALERRIADLESEHASAVEAAAALRRDEQAQHDTRLADETAARLDVEERLRDAEATRDRIHREKALADAAAAERLTSRESELSAASAVRLALEQRLVELETTLTQTREMALAERTAALKQDARRQAEFEAQLTLETDARTAAERNLAETQAASHEQLQTLSGLLDQVRADAAQQAESLTGDHAQQVEHLTADHARQLEHLTVDHAQQIERLTADHTQQVELLAADHTQQVERLTADHGQEVNRLTAGHARQFEQFTAEHTQQVERLIADHAGEIDHQTSARAQAIERLTFDHAAEVNRLEAVVAERDARLQDEAASHLAAQQAAEQSLAALERELRAALAARSRQIDELNGQLEALTRDLRATMSQRDALQLEAHRAPELARQLAATRAESRRRFEQTPVSLLRCSHDGALLDVNHAMSSALGYRSVDELRAAEFPGSVFESPDDFQWLIQRCQNGPRQSGDCILKKKDGSHLGMRIHAAQVSADVIEIVVEDLTSLRATEERLRQAHRMEAVGRLAAEVADTCDNLLQDVSRSGQEWLATLGVDTPERRQGESIFSDVTRAASFLRQLSAYGDKQLHAVSPVDVNKVVRELEPVLKRVAGDDIELVLPKKASALNVDVDAERVERVLVNVAAYGRLRMPSGGRLILELARVSVDRSFVTKYPNVRAGGHALIRVSEVKAANPLPSASRGAAAAGPGVDLGALQTLIGNCGGHLWMNAEPGGNMEVKIRLPLHRPEPGAPVARPSGRAALARWFQS
jgi:hypothetical protein